ncbi:MAG: hypothetical protein EXR92_03365 [Gemmatimonadetes bacterium]|nr:hypothetical protein [Gemmatimonadota bacterium]
MRVIARTLLTLALTGCAGASPAESVILTAPVDSLVTLRLGQIVQIAGGPLRIRFEGVTSDSRCPTNVVCVWEGDATVHLRVAAGEGEGSAVELHTSLDPRSHVTAGYRITLEELGPAPQSGAPISQAGYSAGIRVISVP